MTNLLNRDAVNAKLKELSGPPGALVKAAQETPKQVLDKVEAVVYEWELDRVRCEFLILLQKHYTLDQIKSLYLKED